MIREETVLELGLKSIEIVEMKQLLSKMKLLPTKKILSSTFRVCF